MDKRIVLICNFSDDQGRGILKILGIEHDSSPFVQNYLYDCKDKHYSPRITQSTPYLYLRQDAISTKSINGWQALLIADTLATKDYPRDIFDSDTLVMYHTAPSNIAKYLEQITISSKKQGQHEPGDENGYPLINYLVGAYDEIQQNFKEAEYKDAIDKLIEWFSVDDVLETKLNLLHDCLHPNKVPNSLNKLLTPEYSGAFENFKSEVTGKTWCDKEYIEALTELRRSLLGS